MIRQSKPISYQQLTPVQYPLINKFYARQKLNRKANKADLAFVARQGSEIIAAAIFKPIEPVLFLTGVQVVEEFRGQGIASELLKQALFPIEQAVITFPYQHLQNWYQNLGFEVAATDDLLPELAGRFNAYQNQGRGLVVMCRGG